MNLGYALAQVYKLADYRETITAIKVTGNAYKVKKPIFFKREELMALTGLYSQQVALGIWKDYALDQLHGQALFSVYKHAREAPVFMVSKQAQPSGKGREFLLYTGSRKLKRSANLPDIIAALRLSAT